MSHVKLCLCRTKWKVPASPILGRSAGNSPNSPDGHSRPALSIKCKCVLIQGPNSSACYFNINLTVNIDCLLWSLKPLVRNLMPLPIPHMVISPYLIMFTSKDQSACHNCTLLWSAGHFLCTTAINVIKYGEWVVLCLSSMKVCNKLFESCCCNLQVCLDWEDTLACE